MTGDRDAHRTARQRSRRRSGRYTSPETKLFKKSGRHRARRLAASSPVPASTELKVRTTDDSSAPLTCHLRFTALHSGPPARRPEWLRNSSC